MQAEQAESITVEAGQKVKKGEKIGYLIVGEGGGETSGSGNPHIDLRLLLKDPSLTIDDLLEMYISHNDVSNMPTFLCPFDYSSMRSKDMFERILKKADPIIQCQCPCKFPYNAAECGAGCLD